jgi:hypothetical protein
MAKPKVETWPELQRDAAALKARIEARIAHEIEGIRQACPGVPPSAIRFDFLHGSNDLLAVCEYYAARSPN